MSEVYGPLDGTVWEQDGGDWVPSADGGSIFDGISSFFDGAWDAVGGALGTYMDFENWKWDRQMQKSQLQAQQERAALEQKRALGLVGGASISSGTLLTFAALGVGALLVYKLVK